MDQQHCVDGMDAKVEPAVIHLLMLLIHIHHVKIIYKHVLLMQIKLDV